MSSYGTYEAETDIVKAFQTLIDCTATLENEPLKHQMANAKATLLQRTECCCKETVEFLASSALDEIKIGGSSGSIAHDVVWVLHMMAKCSKAAKQWIMEAGTLTRIPLVMAAFPSHSELQAEGTWLAYVLCGLRGVAELMAGGKGCAALQDAGAWAIYSLAEKQRSKDDVGMIDWPEADAFVQLLLDALREPSATLDLRIICCKTLRILVEHNVCRGNYFLQQGGGAALVDALRLASSTGPAAESLLLAATRLMTVVVEGNAPAAVMLTKLGALQALADGGVGQGSDDVLYETLWALGELGGASAILQVMVRMQDSERVMKKCLAVLAKQLWRPEDTALEELPALLEQLSNITRHFLDEGKDSELARDGQKHSVEALGGVLTILAQHVRPGESPAMERGIQLMAQAVGPGINEVVARSSAASLGHLVNLAPCWRESLAGFVPILGQRISDVKEAEEENVQHQRCFCWVAAIIAGLPAVCEAMVTRQNSPTVQQAAISALIDLLEGLSDSPTPGEAIRNDLFTDHIPKTMEVIISAMRQHRAYTAVQYQGIKALGLLQTHLPPSQDIHLCALDGVLGALKSHPTSYKVASSVCDAMRLFLSPRQGADREVSNAAIRKAVPVLKSQRCPETLRRLLEDFVMATDRELFANAAYILGLIEGPAVILGELESSRPEALVMRGGLLQGLFELERQFQDVLQPMLREALVLVQRVAAEASALVAKTSPEAFNTDLSEVMRLSELLAGLLAANIAASNR